MAARAMWKGVVRVGDINAPVKLYSAVQERTVRFNLLHRKDHVPVEQRMVHPQTGKEVPRDDVRMGYEAEGGTFVILDDTDLEAVEPDDSHDIQVTRFVPDHAIGPQWYDRPYWLGPDGNAAAYAALAAALADEKRTGVAHWVMRKKAYAGALRAEGPHLALITLHHADEVIPVESLQAPEGRKLDEKELRLARQLVEALEGEWDPSKYRDQYRERVQALIEAKRKGQRPRLRLVKKEPTTTGSLATALEKSLAQAKKEKTRAAS